MAKEQFENPGLSLDSAGGNKAFSIDMGTNENQTIFKKVIHVGSDGNSTSSSHLSFGDHDIYGSGNLTRSGDSFSGHSTYNFGKGTNSPAKPDEAAKPDAPNSEPDTNTGGNGSSGQGDWSNSQFISSEKDFDRLNLNKDNTPDNDILTRAEITHGVVNDMLAADANENRKLDKNEWQNISSKFGFNKQGAESAYNVADVDGTDGLNVAEMTQLARRQITPGIMAADRNRSGSIDRTEFKSLVPGEPGKPGNDDDTDSGTDKPSRPGDSPTREEQMQKLKQELQKVEQQLAQLIAWLRDHGVDLPPSPKPTPAPPSDGGNPGDLPTPAPIPPSDGGNPGDLPTPAPIPPSDGGDPGDLPTPAPIPPSDGGDPGDLPTPAPIPPSDGGDPGDLPTPEPPPSDGGEFPDIPGFPDFPGIPVDVNPMFVDPPEGYGRGDAFPDRGTTTPSARAVLVDSVSDSVNQLEKNSTVNPKSVDGDNVYATKPVPEIWIKMNGQNGKPVYMSMQVAHTPFKPSPYSKDANGNTQVTESISFDPYAEYHIDPNMNHANPKLFYRSTDGNLLPLQTTSFKADTGNDSPGHPPGAWYDLSFKVTDDMAFVRQEFTDGNGSEGSDYRAPKNLEKVLIDGKMLSYAEAYNQGLLYGPIRQPVKPAFPDNIWGD